MDRQAARRAGGGGLWPLAHEVRRPERHHFGVRGPSIGWMRLQAANARAKSTAVPEPFRARSCNESEPAAAALRRIDSREVGCPGPPDAVRRWAREEPSRCGAAMRRLCAIGCKHVGQTTIVTSASDRCGSACWAREVDSSAVSFAPSMSLELPPLAKVAASFAEPSQGDHEPTRGAARRRHSVEGVSTRRRAPCGRANAALDEDSLVLWPLRTERDRSTSDFQLSPSP
jgi:hypothetical protein